MGWAIAAIVVSLISAGASIYNQQQQTKAMEKAAKEQKSVVPDSQAPATQESASSAEAQQRDRLRKAAASGRSGTQLTSGGGNSL